MKKGVILVALLACVGGARGQSVVSIDECYRWARENYPLIEQLGLTARAAEYDLANAARGWLPQVSVTAQASHQSDVTSLPFNPAAMGLTGVNIPTPSRDQYNAKIEVGQTVWDGGAIAAARAGIRAAAGVENASTEVNLYTLNERVNGLFFGILMTDQQLARLTLLEKDLATMTDRVEALTRGGVAGRPDADAIAIETLKARQQRIAMESTREAYISMLATLTGHSLGADTRFIKPVVEGIAGAAGLVGIAGVAGPGGYDGGGYTPGISRPEMELFDAQIRGIEVRQKRLNAAITPRLSLFATGGYGRPGLNMLSNDFEAYYVVGARLNWSIGGLYTRRNDRRRIATDRRGVELRRNAFLMNTALDTSLKTSAIERYRQQLSHDDNIIALHESVLRASESKMAGGTISGSDLARDINALDAARQDKIIHEMELLMAVYNLKFTVNE
jgi:outer membrane protein TolC